MITIPTLVILLVVLIVFTILPTALSLFLKNKKLDKIFSIIGIISFIILTLTLTLFNTSLNMKVTKISFNPCSNWFNRPFNFKFWDVILNDLLINALMLAPLGVMVTQKRKAENKKSFIWSLLAGLMLGTFIEVSQAILPYGRFPALSDVILNTFSSMLGCGCLNLCHKIKISIRNKKNTHI